MSAQLELITEDPRPAANRCDECASWTRSLTNHWGECSTRKSYEMEHGGCEQFTRPVVKP